MDSDSVPLVLIAIVIPWFILENHTPANTILDSRACLLIFISLTHLFQTIILIQPTDGWILYERIITGHLSFTLVYLAQASSRNTQRIWLDLLVWSISLLYINPAKITEPIYGINLEIVLVLGRGFVTAILITDVYFSRAGVGEKESQPKVAESTDHEEISLYDIVSTFYPYLWPRSRLLQAHAVLSCLCSISSSAVQQRLPVISCDILNDISQFQVPTKAIIEVSTLAVLNRVCKFIHKSFWDVYETQLCDTVEEDGLSKVFTLSGDYFDSNGTEDILWTLAGVHDILRHLKRFIFIIMPAVMDLALAVGYFSTAFGPYMGVMIGYTAFIYCYIRKSFPLIALTISENHATRNAIVRQQNTIHGWADVLQYGQVKREIEQCKIAANEKSRLKNARTITSDIADSLSRSVLDISHGLCQLLVAYRIKQGQANVVEFATMYTHWNILTNSIHSFAQLATERKIAFPRAEKFVSLVRTKPTIQDDAMAKPLSDCKGKVKFRSVRFSYDKKTNILEDLNFDVEPGATIAVVGLSGQGKSTLLKLLTRIYNPSSGNIYIDDIEIQSITLESLRQNICIVPQSVNTFDGSIMSNIKYARESGSDEEAMDACKAAGIHDDIMKNSEGYGTIVGTKGIKLSGGQEQRIGIARAFFKNAKILLMDEPTSALDLVTENIIRDSLKNAKVTKFIVTHRLTMARDATRILVLQDGKFVESGTHDELVKKQGMYNSLWSAHTASQSST